MSKCDIVKVKYTFAGLLVWLSLGLSTQSRADEILRIGIFGTKDSGISSLIDRFQDDAFSSALSSTTRSGQRKMNVDRTPIDFRFIKVDFNAIANSGIKKSTDVAFLAVDLTQPQENSVNQINTFVRQAQEKGIPVTIVGTKSDLVSRPQQILDNILAQSNYNNLDHAITSSQNGSGVDDVIIDAAKKFLKSKRPGKKVFSEMTSEEKKEYQRKLSATPRDDLTREELLDLISLMDESKNRLDPDEKKKKGRCSIQ
jgi:hypothetical protein